MAIFSGILSGFGLLQIGFLIRSDKTARIAAEAAELSARAAVAIELPIIKMSLSALSNGATLENKIRTDHISVHFVTFTNLGRTKAFPVELRYGFAIKTLPEKPKYTFVDAFKYDDIFDAPSPKEFRKFLSQSYVLAIDAWSDIRSGKLPVWFFCELAYLDFMQDRERNAAYCWRWEPLGLAPGWRTEEASAYNH